VSGNVLDERWWPRQNGAGICNLYALIKSQDEIRRLIEVAVDHTGNLPLLLSIFLNTAVPVVHVADGRRNLSK
jgi:hypothetical protein